MRSAAWSCHLDCMLAKCREQSEQSAGCARRQLEGEQARGGRQAALAALLYSTARVRTVHAVLVGGRQVRSTAISNSSQSHATLPLFSALHASSPSAHTLYSHSHSHSTHSHFSRSVTHSAHSHFSRSATHSTRSPALLSLTRTPLALTPLTFTPSSAYSHSHFVSSRSTAQTLTDSPSTSMQPSIGRQTLVWQDLARFGRI